MSSDGEGEGEGEGEDALLLHGHGHGQAGAGDLEGLISDALDVEEWDDRVAKERARQRFQADLVTHFAVLDCVVFGPLMLVGITLVALYLATSSQATGLEQTISDELTNTDTTGFVRLQTPAQVTEYVLQLMTQVFASPSSVPSLDPANSFLSRAHLVTSMPRFRQLRAPTETCVSFSSQHDCFPPFDAQQQATDAFFFSGASYFGNSSAGGCTPEMLQLTQGAPFQWTVASDDFENFTYSNKVDLTTSLLYVATYDRTGYYVVPNPPAGFNSTQNLQLSQCLAAYLYFNNWYSASTRVAFVEFSTLEINTGLSMAHTFSFQQTAEGLWESQYRGGYAGNLLFTATDAFSTSWGFLLIVGLLVSFGIVAHSAVIYFHCHRVGEGEAERDEPGQSRLLGGGNNKNPTMHSLASFRNESPRGRRRGPWCAGLCQWTSRRYVVESGIWTWWLLVDFSLFVLAVFIAILFLLLVFPTLVPDPWDAGNYLAVARSSWLASFSSFFSLEPKVTLYSTSYAVVRAWFVLAIVRCVRFIFLVPHGPALQAGMARALKPLAAFAPPGLVLYSAFLAATGALLSGGPNTSTFFWQHVSLTPTLLVGASRRAFGIGSHAALTFWPAGWAVLFLVLFQAALVFVFVPALTAALTDVVLGSQHDRGANMIRSWAALWRSIRRVSCTSPREEDALRSVSRARAAKARAAYA